MRYLVELVQIDPQASESPGCGHYAGQAGPFRTRRAARRAARQRIGKPAASAEWAPCCDWQDPTQPIAGAHIVDADTSGNLYSEGI
jgi:hypothetical protein